MYYTLSLNEGPAVCYAQSQTSRTTPWNDLCDRAVQILSTWLEEACDDRWIPDKTFNHIDAIQAAFVRREQTFLLPYALELPAAGKLEAQTLRIGQVCWEINQVVLFGDSQAGHMTATGGAAPWPVVSDVPGERGQFYWLKPGQFIVTDYSAR